MDSITTLARAPRLSDEVASSLAGAIQRHEFAAGARLPAERELAQKFGVSRIVVREAMAQLKSEGMIETRQGSGAFVSIDRERVPFRLGSGVSSDLRAVFELRVAVEGAAAAMAATRADSGQRAAIGVAVAAMRIDIEAGRDGVAADEDFHAAIANGSGNEYIVRFIAFLGVHLKRAIAAARSNTAERLPQEIMAVQSEHERIHSAIVARDPAAAEAAMKLHLSNAISRLGLVLGREACET